MITNVSAWLGASSSVPSSGCPCSVSTSLTSGKRSSARRVSRSTSAPRWSEIALGMVTVTWMSPSFIWGRNSAPRRGTSQNASASTATPASRRARRRRQRRQRRHERIAQRRAKAREVPRPQPNEKRRVLLLDLAVLEQHGGQRRHRGHREEQRAQQRERVGQRDRPEDAALDPL